MPKSFDAFLSDALEEIELAGLTRRLTPLETLNFRSSDVET